MAKTTDAKALREKLAKTEAKLRKARAKIRELRRELGRHDADLEMRLRDVAERGEAIEF